MSGFTFNENDSFADNWKAFLGAMDSVDLELAAILRTNGGKLAAIVREGNRNASARGSFNAEVLKALDSLLPADQGGK
jgi:hypothetical protein